MRNLTNLCRRFIPLFVVIIFPFFLFQVAHATIQESEVRECRQVMKGYLVKKIEKYNAKANLEWPEKEAKYRNLLEKAKRLESQKAGISTRDQALLDHEMAIYIKAMGIGGTSEGARKCAVTVVYWWRDHASLMTSKEKVSVKKKTLTQEEEVVRHLNNLGRDSSHGSAHESDRKRKAISTEGSTPGEESAPSRSSSTPRSTTAH